MRLGSILCLGAAVLAMAPYAGHADAGTQSPQAEAGSDQIKPDGTLLAQFRDPPQSARPEVWWHWLNGNVSAEGARLDLEWMHRVGIGGIHAFSGGGLGKTVVPQPLEFMTPGWADAFASSVSLARSMGMKVTIAGSPGWSQTGGPWVAPRDGMKKYVWSETTLSGGREVTQRLSVLPTQTGGFQGLARGHGLPSAAVDTPVAHGSGPVIAVRTSQDDAPLQATLTGPDGALDSLSTNVDLAHSVTLPMPTAARPTALSADLGGIRKVASITLAADPLPPFLLQASDDGLTFRDVGRFTSDHAAHPVHQQTVTFPTISARHIRIVLEAAPPPQPMKGVPANFSIEAFTGPPRKALELRRIALYTQPHISRFEGKAGFEPVVGPVDPIAHSVSPAAALSEVIDVTDQVDADGVLRWTAPEGDWTILRFGWSLTGQTNGPAEKSATGLEVDKLDAAAVERYINAYFALYRDKARTAMGAEGINGLLTDSWEVGTQNWTPTILADFRRLRGYDPLPWLPTLTGRVVKSQTQSDAFLFDWRRTIKDLVLSNHYAVLARAAHARGMTYTTEVQGDTPRGLIDALAAKAEADIPAGEFWYRAAASDEGQPPLIADLQEAASAAHLRGKTLVAAEALTVAAGMDMWGYAPNRLKPVADQIFALGVNRLMLHHSHHQPFVDRKPGLSMHFIGQFFNRNDTWAEDAKPWVDYLSRTSFMLQQGQDIADIAYIYGEDRGLTEIFQHKFNTDVPAGYGFDYMDGGTLLNRTSVSDGALVTDGGARYRVVYLAPTADRLTQQALEKLLLLVRQGATLVGKRPIGRLGLAGDDRAFQALADALWGDASGAQIRRVGTGRVYPSGNLTTFLRSADGFVPDVDRAAPDDIMWRHRRTKNADIYYVSNRHNSAVSPTISFRVAGHTPQWWSPDTGQTKPLAYRVRDDRTEVALPLQSQEAGFVVFSGDASPQARTVHAVREHAEMTVKGPWSVTFTPMSGMPFNREFGQLTDWSRATDPAVRYFSGAATYETTVDVPAHLLKSGRLTLDLGDVRELAVVTVNGQPAGTSWHAPYTLDLTDKIIPGRNKLQIKVVNLWTNRLIGDKQPGETPASYAPESAYLAISPLQPSGLLGQIILRSEQ